MNELKKLLEQRSALIGNRDDDSGVLRLRGFHRLHDSRAPGEALQGLRRAPDR